MLPETVRDAARRFGDAPAFVGAHGTPLSYAQLDRRSDEAAVGMAGRGVSEGRIVVLTLPSSPAYAVAYVAAAKLGAVTAGVNNRLTDEERRTLLDLVEPALVVEAPEQVEELRVPGEGPPEIPTVPDRAVCIVFTSGTTGTPKGAVFTNRQLEAAARIETGGAWGGGGPSLSATPFPHVGFMTRFTWQLRLGGTMHVMERWTAGEALRLVEELRLPTVGGIPAQVALMLRHPDFDRRDLACVDAVVLGGGPASPGLRRDARNRFRAPVCVRFSCTESGGIGTGTALDAGDEEALYTVGRPRGPVELSIRDSESRPVPPGEVGEICLRSPAVMAGYWLDPDSTAVAFDGDGFLRTGDLGLVDAAGCLRLAGRSKEMYVRGGYNVYPAEVEAVLSLHPQVEEVAVVPRPDEVMGEIGVAVVVPARGPDPPTLEELRTFGGERLASYKLPEDLRVVDALPLTPMHKLDRSALAGEVRA